jgi:preprotein translocase subunit SecF
MSLHFIKPDTKIDFIGFRWWAFALSAAMIVVGAISMIAKGGLRYGIDFAGGVIVELKFEAGADMDAVKKTLDDIPLPGLVVQRLGAAEARNYLIRSSAAEATSESVRTTIGSFLESRLPGVHYTVQRQEMVGPKVGEDLRGRALEAMYYAILLIAIYISGRFEQRWMAAGIMAAALAGGIYVLQLFHVDLVWLIVAALLITLGLCWYLKLNYALGAILSLIHDVLTTVGIFSLLNKEFDLTIIAALLTLIGYSLNDTIIVFDRIREIRRANTGDSLPEIINKSVNQTLSRTVMTSGLTFLAVLSLYLFGGHVINDFALAMLIGIVVGTYSSIYVAAPVIVTLTPETVKPAGPMRAKAKA